MISFLDFRHKSRSLSRERRRRSRSKEKKSSKHKHKDRDEKRRYCKSYNTTFLPHEIFTNLSISLFSMS